VVLISLINYPCTTFILAPWCINYLSIVWCIRKTSRLFKKDYEDSSLIYSNFFFSSIIYSWSLVSEYDILSFLNKQNHSKGTQFMYLSNMNWGSPSVLRPLIQLILRLNLAQWSMPLGSAESAQYWCLVRCLESC